MLTFDKYDDKRWSQSFIYTLIFIYHISILRHVESCKTSDILYTVYKRGYNFTLVSKVV